MSDTTGTPTVTHEVILQGCTPEPLMNYLKALGILRLVAEDHEHGDPDTRGFWRDDGFVLRSTRLFAGASTDEARRQKLVEFFLNHYRPTPIVVPWSGGDFFDVDWDLKPQLHKKTPTSSKIIEAYLNTKSDRLSEYREALTTCKAAMDACGVHKKDDIEPNKGTAAKRRKAEFLVHLRSGLRTESVAWLDAAATVADSLQFAPLLGSGGGSDGNTHFSDNFMQNLWDVLPAFDDQRDHKATRGDATTRSGLRSALFGEASTFRVEKRTSSLFDSGAVGGPNATQGMERESMSNPWDVILGLEGTILFAAAAVKRMAAGARAASSFPFQFDASPTRSDGLAEKEAAGRELWLPLWHRAASLGEIRGLMSEGRAEAGRRSARSGVDMARAIATLGVDRGVSAFRRFAIVKGRVGGDNYNTAVSLGRFAVTERPGADLLCEIDLWLDSFRKAVATSGNKPENRVKRFVAAERHIDAAIFDFCRYGGATHFADIHVALGRAEREMALTPNKIGQSKTKVGPIAGLSFDWVRAAAGLGETATDTPLDVSSLDLAFQIALALAGIRHEPHKAREKPKLGPLRSNLEPVSTWYDKYELRTKAKWAEKDRAVVWNAADLSANLAAVLSRRVMDGEREGCENLPLAPAHDRLSASPVAIAAFLNGELDHRRIEDLLWGLMLVDPPGWNQNQFGSARRAFEPPHKVQATELPPIYCLLKLLFLHRDLIVSKALGRTLWNLSGPGERGTHRIRPEPTILALLRAGRVGEAATIAMRRLRSSGLTPLPHRRSGGPSRDGVWEEVRMTPRQGQRLAAALLIPIDPSAINALVHRATRGDDVDTSSAADTVNNFPAAAAASPSVET